MGRGARSARCVARLRRWLQGWRSSSSARRIPVTLRATMSRAGATGGLTRRAVRRRRSRRRTSALRTALPPELMVPGTGRRPFVPDRDATLFGRPRDAQGSWPDVGVELGWCTPSQPRHSLQSTARCTENSRGPKIVLLQGFPELTGSFRDQALAAAQRRVAATSRRWLPQSRRSPVAIDLRSARRRHVALRTTLRAAVFVTPRPTGAGRPVSGSHPGLPRR